MKFNKWTLGLAAAGRISLVSVPPEPTKKGVVETPYPEGYRGGPHPHERFQKDGMKDESLSSFVSSTFAGDKSSSGKDPYECECPCHREGNGNMVHCMPCCDQAPCGLMIKINCMQLHLNQCQKCRTVGEQAEP